MKIDSQGSWVFGPEQAGGLSMRSTHPCHGAAFAVASWWHEAVTGGKITSLGEERVAGDAMALGAGLTGRRAEGTAAEKFAQDLYDLALTSCLHEYGLSLLTDYGPEYQLGDLAEKHDLWGCFPNKTYMSATIDIVTVVAGYHAPTVVLYDALAAKVAEAYALHDGACPKCRQPWQGKHFEGTVPAVREVNCWAAVAQQDHGACSASIERIGREAMRKAMLAAAKVI